MLSEKDKKVFDDAYKFAIEKIEPKSYYYETTSLKDNGLLKMLQEAGYSGIDLPAAVGGKEYNYLQTALVYEAFAHGSPTIAFYLQLHNNITLMIERLTENEHIKDIVRDMVNGEATNNFALTEDVAGSDPASTNSYCEEKEDGYHIHGMKDWIANAVDVDYFVLMVKNGQPKGMNIFLVDRKLDGISVKKKDDIIAGNMLAAGTVYFDDVVVPKDMLLSTDGFKESLVAIDVARVFVPAMCIGLAQRSIDIVSEYLSTRISMGKPVLASEGIQWQLAEMQTKVDVARQYVYYTANVKDSGEKINIIGAENKLFATDIAMDVTTKCMQFMGANGLYESSAVSRNWRMAKMFNITDGTGEIMKYIIGRNIYRKHRK